MRKAVSLSIMRLPKPRSLLRRYPHLPLTLQSCTLYSSSRRWVASASNDTKSYGNPSPPLAFTICGNLDTVGPTFQRSGRGELIEVDLPGDVPTKSTFDVLFLRDSCSCSRCVDSSTQQKLFETSDLPPEITVKKIKQLPNGDLQIEWDHDLQHLAGHQSIFTTEFLKHNLSLGSRTRADHNQWHHIAWDRQTLGKHQAEITFDYFDYAGKRSTLDSVIEQLQIFGIAFITSIPSDPSSVRTIAARIGPLRNTFYGETWDVKSVSSAKNVAYTSRDLDFHMDLLYMENPPGLQFLHCIKQSPTGGESRFSDALRAFYKLQEHDSRLVTQLENFPVTYRYKNDGHWYQKTRSFLEGGTVSNALREKGSPLRFYPLDFDAINWAPPFQGPLEQNIRGLDGNRRNKRTSLRDYIQAARTFKQYAASEDAVYRTKMEEGTCVIFNNRRILHARDPFDPQDGERWLRGCYVDSDCLRSQWRVRGI